MFTSSLRLALPAALSLVLLPAMPLGAQTVFQQPDVLVTSVPLTGAAVGDVDEDGIPDIVTTPWGGTIFDFNEYELFLGQGDGTFVSAATGDFTTTSSAIDLHLVDWDDDEHLDLVAASSQGSNQTIAVKFGDGDGTFSDLTFFSAVDSCTDMAVADMNADGIEDVATITPATPPFFPSDIRVRVSQPNGSSSNAILAPLGSPSSVAIGQVGPAALLDVVVASFDGTIASYLYNGGTSFSAPVTTATGTLPSQILLVSLDGDDRLDLVVADGNSGRVLTFLNNGNGSFTPAGTFAAGSNPAFLAAGDMDGDGIDDVIVASPASEDVHVLLNRGGGVLERVVSVSNVASPRRPQLDDLDGDGDLDVVVPSQALDHAVVVLVNRTYLPGEPWLDRGNALPGENGYPIQLCTGTLLAGDPFTFEVTNALPDGTAFLVLGLSELNAPFKLGIMVPDLDVFLKPIFIDAQGEVFIGGVWGPGFPSGLQFWMQYWWADPGGPAGFAGTNAVRGTGP